MSLNWHILMLLPVLITIAWYCKIGVSPPIFPSFLLKIVLAIPRSFEFPNNMHIYVYLCVYIYVFMCICTYLCVYIYI